MVVLHGLLKGLSDRQWCHCLNLLVFYKWTTKFFIKQIQVRWLVLSNCFNLVIVCDGKVVSFVARA